MDPVGHQILPVAQGGVEIDQFGTRKFRHADYCLTCLVAPLPCAGAETVVLCAEWGEVGYDHSDFGVGLSQGVDQGHVVPFELVAIFRPVSRVCVINPEMDYRYVATEFHRLTEFGLVEIGPVAAAQQCSARTSEVAHFIVLA